VVGLCLGSGFALVVGSLFICCYCRVSLLTLERDVETRHNAVAAVRRWH
jgi:hypothetical protein